MLDSRYSVELVEGSWHGLRLVHHFKKYLLAIFVRAGLHVFLQPLQKIVSK